MERELHGGKIFLLGLAIGLMILGCIYLGGYWVCHNGGGEMYKQEGITKRYFCANMKDLGVCNVGDEIFIPRDQTELDQVGLYKELLENGTLSEEAYIRNHSGKVEVIAKFV